MRYELGDGAAYTLTQCARILRLSKSRVSQIQIKAIGKLASTIRGVKLKALFLGLRHVPDNFFEKERLTDNASIAKDLSAESST